MSSALRRWALFALALAGTGAVLLLGAGSPASAAQNPINHVVVIYQENWSFDALYGKFPGANGLDNAANARKQVDKAGTVYEKLPQPIDSNLKPPAPDTRFPADLPNAPFDFTKYVPAEQKTGDLVHRFYQEQLQIEGAIARVTPGAIARVMPGSPE